MIVKNDIIKKFEGSLSENVKLSNFSWFNLGGNAEYFFKAKNKDQLIAFLKEAKKIKSKITLLGAGSNTLIRDNGVKGFVIKLGKDFSFIKKISDNVLEVGAATLDRFVANFAKDNNLKGLEFLSCIPGSIGGAVIMNSGCYDNDISKVLISITAINKNDLTEIELKKEDIKFLYRGTNLKDDLIIVSAKLRGSKGKREEIEKFQTNLIEKKKISQPSQIKTCGSTFKNTKNYKAWELIKKSNCEKMFVGKAKISQKHCNFFVNNGNAKSSDIEKLINKVKKTVSDKVGVNLELEIKIIGE